jgi:hypothetical protein
MKVLLFLLLFLFPVPTSAAQYYYTGVSKTAKVAYTTEARLRMDAHPKCKSISCHAIAWTALWDAGGTGQYVEVGIGYSDRARCGKNTSVALWWASPQRPAGVFIGCVAKGTDVLVSATRSDGEEGVTATWEWEGGKVTRWVPTPGWVTGPGIHPTKIEVYSARDRWIPGPVSLFVSDVRLYAEDTEAFLQQTAPYWAVPGSTTATFAVAY